MGDRRSEASLADARNLLVASPDQRLGFDFFGGVVDDLPADVAGKTLYLTGDVARFRGRLDGAARVFAVEELASNYDSLERVRLGRVPVRVGGVGVYYRRFFADDDEIFRRVCSEHTFQTLTESVKPSKAHRTGIYLTPVHQRGDDLSFHLLRCSTNLSGQPKDSGVGFEVPLEHDSVVAFSLDSNRRFTHAITLRAAVPDNEWFGITFRTSKTLLRFVDGHPTLPSGARLTLASEDQRRELFQMRRRENQETSFEYPPLSYTLSESDLLPPAP
jgi:hypothetical protein